MKRVLVVMGTRPEVIKLAPIIHKLRARSSEAELIVCSTGQHREMLDSAMKQFDLHAEHDLGLMQPGQTPTDLLGRALLALQKLLTEVKPDVVVVQGDTTTVTAAALAAFMNHIQVAHVEAGLRTQDKRAPFPEEVNRRVAGVVADLHFAPTQASADNLLREGVDPSTVFVTGNTVVDALRWVHDRVKSMPPLPAEMVPPGKRLVLVTAHRRESFGDAFRELCLSLRDIAERFSDVQILYPVHLNPNVRAPVFEILGSVPGVKLIEPLEYSTFVRVMLASSLILTDSGGIQEEAPSIGKPTLVLREKTERPEAVAAGAVRLVGTDRAKIVREATAILSDPALHARLSRPLNVYGDGLAADRIADLVIHGSTRLPPFKPESFPASQG
jgi:UDP-N-acetylglucosamine 2-epimerase (non-hydrolysing)